MKNKYQIFFGILILTSFNSCSQKKVVALENKKAQPNVIFIIADDLGYEDIAAYGSSFYETPNIDKLASNATRFTNGYANCPVCSPSRASFQTGKYPVNTGVTDWIKGRKVDPGTTPNDRWIVPDTEYDMKLSETTIAEALKQQGYNTGFIGKWHLGETEAFWPENQGYDVNIGGWSAGGPQHSKGSNGYFSPYGNPRLKDGPVGEYLPERLTNEAITLLKSNTDKPFFMCLSYYLVHAKLQAKEEDIAIFKEKRAKLGITEVQEFSASQPWMETASGTSKQYKERIKQGNPTYAAMIKALDDNVGRIISYLKQTGTYDNTLIIFVSDNGGLSTAEGSSTSNLPLAKGKGWIYEGGIRVPFIIKSPNSKKASVADMPVTGVDFFPTIMAYANNLTKFPSIDGMNLKPFIDEGKVAKERPLFWHYPHYPNQGANPASAIRLGDFKLIHDLELDSYELYNLKSDIGETKNLASSLPEKTAALKAMLNNWVTKNYNKKLEPNPNWNGIDLK
ncbi:sulfatase [Flavobacterium sp.]|uniref:sulfatase n=1 Tax=Flavobacterium sp. TaxID=239 RepID=UPI00286D9420|nr:sulfatase [Flavobacterium sp.]